MSKLKISFSPDFFSEKSKRKKWEIFNDKDQLCAEISDIYQSANAILNSTIKFDEDDRVEIQREGYDIIEGAALEEKTIAGLKKALEKKGVENSSQQDMAIALILQTKYGLQGKLISQMTGFLMEHGDKDWRVDNKRVRVTYDNFKGEIIFKAANDILAGKKIIGNSQFQVAIKNNKISLKKFTVEIDKSANGVDAFANNMRKNENIVDTIVNLFKSIFTLSTQIDLKPTKVKPLELKPRRLKFIDDTNSNKPIRSKSADFTESDNSKKADIARSASSDAILIRRPSQ